MARPTTRSERAQALVQKIRERGTTATPTAPVEIPEEQVVEQLPEGDVREERDLVTVSTPEGKRYYKPAPGGYVQTGPTGVEVAKQEFLQTEAGTRAAQEVAGKLAGKDLATAIRGGEIETVRKARDLGLITEEQLVEAQVGAAGVPIREYAGRRLAEAGIDPTKPVNLRTVVERNIPASTLRQAGFDVTEQQVAEARQVIESERTARDVTRQREASQEAPVPREPVSGLEAYKTDEGLYRVSDYLRDNYDETKPYTGENKRRLDSAVSTLQSVGFTPEQISDARVAAFASPVGKIAPVAEGVKPPSFMERKTAGLETWVQELTSDIQKSVVDIPYDEPVLGLPLTSPKKVAVSTAAGVMLAGLTVATAVPILLGRIVSKPTDAPALAVETGRGMVNHVIATATNLVNRKYFDDMARGDLSSLVYDTAMSYMIVSGAGRGARGTLTKLTTYIHPRGIPASVIAKEASTGRLPVYQSVFVVKSEAIKTITNLKNQGVDAQLITVRGAKGTPAKYLVADRAIVRSMADALNRTEVLALQRGGSFTGEVPIKGTPFSYRYTKTPMEQVVGDILFHGTKDTVNPKGVITKPSAIRTGVQTGEVVIQRGGLYTSPWAAVAFSRGGSNPGLLMILTDSTKIKSGAAGLTRGITQSEAFIRGAERGFYGSSKGWRGDLETEIVGARGTRIVVPKPTADLTTRMLAGNFADFFTYDSGRFMPIKIGMDASLIKSGKLIPPTAATLYAVKLRVLESTLYDLYNALRRPDLVLKDVSAIAKSMSDFDVMFGSGTGITGSGMIPGVRNVYLTTSLGTRIKILADRLWNKAMVKTNNQAAKRNIPTGSPTYMRLAERNLENAYKASARSIISAYKVVASGYRASPRVRNAFEQSYLTNLGITLEAAVKTSADAVSTADIVYRDAKTNLSTIGSIKSPATYSPAYSSETPTVLSEVRTVGTPEREPVTREPITEEMVTGEPVTREPTTRPPREPVTRPPTTETPPTTVSRVIPPGRPPERPRTPERLPERLRTPETPRTPERVPERPERPERVPDRLPERLPERPLETPTVAPPMPLGSTVSPATVTIPEGSVAWRQGIFWKWIPPTDFKDGVKPRTLPKGITPAGAVHTDLRTPEETIQMIGRPGARTPSVSIDLGIADIYISKNGRSIRYAGHGLETDVGRSLEGETVGMSVPSVGIGHKKRKPRKSELYFDEDPAYWSRLSHPLTREPRPRHGRRRSTSRTEHPRMGGTANTNIT